MSATPPRPADARASSTGVLHVYRVPAALASASILGLLSALVGDGVLDVLSWLALGGVIATAVWAPFVRRQRRAH